MLTASGLVLYFRSILVYSYYEYYPWSVWAFVALLVLALATLEFYVIRTFSGGRGYFYRIYVWIGAVSFSAAVFYNFNPYGLYVSIAAACVSLIFSLLRPARVIIFIPLVIFSPYILSTLPATEVQFSIPEGYTDPERELNVIVIMDEFDAHSARKILARLRVPPTKYAEVNRKYFNTADAMVRLFYPDYPLSQVSPCGPKTLCAGGELYRLGRFPSKIGGSPTFYRGFYFNPCGAHDKGNCRTAPLLHSMANQFACFYERNFSPGNFTFCSEKYKHFQRQATAAIADFRTFAASNASGLVIIHLALAHPPGPTGSILADVGVFEMNAVSAINDVLEVLVGKSYQLSVIADHPFRREIWCESSFYASGSKECDELPKDFGLKTPIVSWSAP
jgi:hypothetical protein